MLRAKASKSWFQDPFPRHLPLLFSMGKQLCCAPDPERDSTCGRL